MRLGAAAAAIGIALFACGCGSKTASSSATLDRTCKREPAALASLGPVRNLGDALRVLGGVVRIERRTLDDVTAAGGHEQFAGRLRLSMAGARRSLTAITGADPQQTMTPVRTGVPDARRAAAQAGSLLQSLCAEANA
jgi:hypothetical protein